MRRTGLLALVVGGLLLRQGVGAEAQTAPAHAEPSQTRIVVYQFTSVPDDSSHRAFAFSVTRSLVRELIADSALKVMSTTRDRTRANGNAQYGIIGSVASLGGRIGIDVRVLDILGVAVVARETIPILGPPVPDAVTTAVRLLAERIHTHLVGRAQ